MATLVLVPCPWHGGWGSELLARRLRRHGHEDNLLTLTGVGNRKQRPVTLDRTLAISWSAVRVRSSALLSSLI